MPAGAAEYRRADSQGVTPSPVAVEGPTSAGSMRQPILMRISLLTSVPAVRGGLAAKIRTRHPRYSQDESFRGYYPASFAVQPADERHVRQCGRLVGAE